MNSNKFRVMFFLRTEFEDLGVFENKFKLIRTVQLGLPVV